MKDKGTLKIYLKHRLWKKGICVVCILSVLSCLVLSLSGCGVTDIFSTGKKPRKFGATYMTRSNPFFDVLHEAINEVVESNGDILISRDPQQNQEKQNAQILEMIDEGIELLFLNPVDWEAVKPALVACQEAGVPVINIDTIVKDTEYVVSVIETNNYQAGVLCAEDMMERVEEAKILILNNPIQQSITQREQGFMDTIEGKEQYEVVCREAAGGELQVAAEVTAKDIIEQGIVFDVILGGNDPTALGALSALQQYNMTEGVLVYGIDGSPDFKAMLELGYATATSMQTPKGIGATAAEVAYQYLNGEAVPDYISIEPELITCENIREYEIGSWQ